MSTGMLLLDRLAEHAGNTPDALAVREVAMNRTLTYSQLAGEVVEFSSQVRALPLPGPIVLRCRNCCEYIVAFLGILDAGRAVFPVAPDIAAAELGRAIEIAGAAYVVTHELRPSIASAAPGERKVDDAPALLLQSSGTTGLPKVVLREATAVDAVARNIVAAVRFTGNDQVLAAVPLCHSYGLEHGLLAPILAGSAVHLLLNFDMPAIQRELGGGGITLFPAVPSIFEMLANVAASAPIAGLRCAYSAGAPLPASVTDALGRRLRLRVGQIYGTTEFGSATFNDPEATDFDAESVGVAMDGVRVRVGNDGSLSIAAPSMFSAYLNEAPPVGDGGYFPTGDLARVDHRGRIYITGRTKLLIDIGGLKVNPLEIESVLLTHPQVGAAVIVPVKVTDTISRLKAIVTPRDPAAAPTGEELRLFARARLTPYKVPRLFEIRADLPRSPTGKILRHLLVEAR